MPEHEQHLHSIANWFIARYGFPTDVGQRRAAEIIAALQRDGFMVVPQEQAP